MPDVLSDEHCDCLNRCLQVNAECAELIRRLKEAGLDVEAFESENAAKGALAAALKKQFFPGRP